VRTVVTLTLTALVALIVAGFMGGWFGGPARQPAVRVEAQRVIVENQTNAAWHDVAVTINAYYRAKTASLEPGGRVELPLANLETGLGQRFNAARESVRTIEVRATDAAGKPVALEWDEGK